MIKNLFYCSASLILLASCEVAQPVTKKYGTRTHRPMKNYTYSEKKNTSAPSIKREKTLSTPTTKNESNSYSYNNTSVSTKNLISSAEKYLGTPYKLGGMTHSGFDCSGFVSKVFEENNHKLPRRSSDQANVGNPISIQQVKPGDLLFFATSGGTRVSHVGIVHSIQGDEVKFIHSSTSKGVIISSMKEKYWNNAYLHAKRVL